MSEIIRCLAEECQRLNEENEALRTRVAELEELVAEAHDLFEDIREGSYSPDTFTSQPYRTALDKDNSQTWLLRQKAEAVKEFAAQIKENHAEVMGVWILRDAEQYIQRLRQRADEIERGD